jgi:hypothetical protein
VDTRALHEHNRTPASRAVNRYLKRIEYGNRRALPAVGFGSKRAGNNLVILERVD